MVLSCVGSTSIRSGARRWRAERITPCRRSYPSEFRATAKDAPLVRRTTSALDEFRRLKGERTGRALIDALQASPHRRVDVEPRRQRMPVRDIDL